MRAILQLLDIPYLGSFRCPDERLNMQDCLWDGIKRNRLVWLGDMYPEVSVINAVFGANDVVPRSHQPPSSGRK